MYYRSIRETLNSKSIMVPDESDYSSFIKDEDKDYYMSLYVYTDEQKKLVEDNNNKISGTGIRDTVTNYLFWDFDSKELLQAKKDTLNLVETLIRLGLTKDQIDVHFTGCKGFSVQVKLNGNNYLTNQQFRTLTSELAKNYPSYDTKINDPNRIIRLPNTLHQVSNKFKVQLTIEQLRDFTIPEILTYANEPHELFKVKGVDVLPTNLVELLNKPVKKELVATSTSSTNDIDYAQNKHLSNCRWSLQNGNFKEGERNSAFLCLAATYKNMGYKEELTYRMLKGVAELQSTRFNCDRYPDHELYNNIIKIVYSPHWQNGQFTCRTEGTWLAGYCKTLSEHSCDAEKKYDTIVDLNDALLKFRTHAKNIDKNTIKTGIPELDNRTRITIGQHIAILGAPSSGKSSLALQMLENTSLSGVNSIFFCMDMSDTTTVEKLYQRAMSKNADFIYKVIQNNNNDLINMDKNILDRYRNVKFCFQNGLTVEKIRDIVIEEQKKQNGNLKLVVVDYAGRVMGPYSDMTANSAIVANGLRSIANELGVCVITLVQPPKSAGDARDELYSMRQIKGSSVMEEAIDKLFAVFRPGFNPMNDSKDDKYIIMPLLKNRQGGLFCLNFKWDGLTGSISSLEMTRELEEIEQLIQTNRARKHGDGGWNE
jgi:hypothetical protein